MINHGLAEAFIAIRMVAIVYNKVGKKDTSIAGCWGGGIRGMCAAYTSVLKGVNMLGRGPGSGPGSRVGRGPSMCSGNRGHGRYRPWLELSRS